MRISDWSSDVCSSDLLSNLDLVLRRELLDLFRKLFAEMEASVLYITHDIREAALLGDRVAVMEAGRLVATGTLAELSGLKSPIVREILDAPKIGRAPCRARVCQYE